MDYDTNDLIDDLLLAVFFSVTLSFIIILVYAFGQWLGGQL